MVTGVVVELVDVVESRLEQIVATCVARYDEQLPAYAAIDDPTLRTNIAEHTRSVFVAVLNTLREGRVASTHDFPITSEQTTLRRQAGMDLADFLSGWRLGQTTLWEAIVEAADTPLRRAAALDAATHLMRVIEVGSSMAGQVYMAAQQADMAESDRLRRDLLEDLLSGREMVPTRTALASSAGLERGTPIVVIVAEPVGRLHAGQSLRSALSVVRGSFDAGTRGLTELRQDQLIGILRSVGDGSRLTRELERARAHVARQGIDLAIGISTVHPGLAGVPEAFREASIALESLAGAGGVGSMSTLSTLDYLVLREDPTARRLIRPDVRHFVEDDLVRDGGLVRTLLAYVDADLNAKIAAEGLHVHVNTAYYRLERIAERTGCDLRKFGDLEELLIAIRLLSPPTAAHG